MKDCVSHFDLERLGLKIVIRLTRMPTELGLARANHELERGQGIVICLASRKSTRLKPTIMIPISLAKIFGIGLSRSM